MPIDFLAEGKFRLFFFFIINFLTCEIRELRKAKKRSQQGSGILILVSRLSHSDLFIM